MVYFGSKARVWGGISPHVLRNINASKVYFEPFGGGMNAITNVPSELVRVAADADPFLITLWQGLQRGIRPPEIPCTREEYVEARLLNDMVFKDKSMFTSLTFELSFRIGCWKYLASFSARPFEGLGLGSGYRNYYAERCKNILKHVKKAVDLQSIQFIHGDYRDTFEVVADTIRDVCTPQEVIIYADPPYQYTTTYRNARTFNHEAFWQWCRYVRSGGYQLFISELTAPNDFTPIWTAERVVGVQQTKIYKDTSIEFLYT